MWVDAQGVIMEDKMVAVRQKTWYILTRPKMVFFVDEVGDNTSQKDDGNVGGQKFVVENNACALICSSYADSNFTILGFTNACRDAVCCAIILAMTEVEAKW